MWKFRLKQILWYGWPSVLLVAWFTLHHTQHINGWYFLTGYLGIIFIVYMVTRVVPRPVDPRTVYVLQSRRVISPGSPGPRIVSTWHDEAWSRNKFLVQQYYDERYHRFPYLEYRIITNKKEGLSEPVY